MLSYFITGPFIYISVLVFVVVTAYKVLSYKKMPRHLRWDLYPVPHQGLEGSKYQKVNFHEKAPTFSHAHEMIAMSQEMLLIKKAFDHNRRLWIGTWPLHIGIYLSGLWIVLLIAGGIVGVQGPTMLIGSSLIAWAISKFTVLVGVMGFVMGLFGSLVLLWLRYTDDDLRYIADFVTYLNLWLMTVIFALGLAAWLLADPYFDIIRSHIMALLTFKVNHVSELPVVLEMLVFGLFLLYLPFSRMMHFAAKYFFYHHIMWDDEAVARQSALEKNIEKSLQYKLNWSSDHIITGETWAKQGATEQAKEEVK